MITRCLLATILLMPPGFVSAETANCSLAVDSCGRTLTFDRARREGRLGRAGRCKRPCLRSARRASHRHRRLAPFRDSWHGLMSESAPAQDVEAG